MMSSRCKHFLNYRSCNKGHVRNRKVEKCFRSLYPIKSQLKGLVLHISSTYTVRYHLHKAHYYMILSDKCFANETTKLDADNFERKRISSFLESAINATACEGDRKFRTREVSTQPRSQGFSSFHPD